jgi:tRNA dimethylallyltransferase
MQRSSSSRPPLVVIAGPTASGKTALALEIAQARRGTIINADASQVYVDLEILSARPGADETACAPHRLFGVFDGAESCSAARWAALAREAIAEARAEARLPILVGGTGLYLKTLLDGIADVPAIPADLREQVRALDGPALRAALEREDQAMAARLHPNDRQRTARALEVRRATGRSLADWQQQGRGGLRHDVSLEVHLRLPPRDSLYAACNSRFDAMMAAGALEEVARLAARRLPPALPVMKALGVPPLLAHLEGRLPLADAIEAAKLETRRYAKRQLTWFASGGQADTLRRDAAPPPPA